MSLVEQPGVTGELGDIGPATRARTRPQTNWIVPFMARYGLVLFLLLSQLNRLGDPGHVSLLAFEIGFFTAETSLSKKVTSLFLLV